jgi:UMF1 family MFS transporter
VRVASDAVRQLFKNRPALAWAMYDWANSAFATTVMAGFFPVFFQKFWSVDVAPTDTTSRLGYGNAIAGAVIAVLAPILGAIADRGGRRKQFMFAWTLLGVVATGGLYLAAHGQWFLALSMFVLATIGFNGGIVFKAEHLRRILAKYATYYNEVRTHVSLEQDAPCT